MASSSDLRLRTVTRTQGNNAALKNGVVAPRGIQLEFEEVDVLVHAFRRMVRELAYDVCEMALTTYLCARDHGTRFTALPIFLVRGLHHDKVVHNRRSDIRSPLDLEGRRVGVHRGYTVTTGVWARGILADEHGVDLDRVTWVLSGDEHVAEYEPPSNVVPLDDSEDLPALLTSGGIGAAVNVDVDHPDVAPLIPDATEAAFTALEDRGFYPINHLVVVRDDVLEKRPEVAVAIFDAFATAKRDYVERLRGGDIPEPTAADRLHRRVIEVTGADPLPYGIDPNRQMLETLMRYAADQQIVRRPVPVESLFAEATRDLTA